MSHLASTNRALVILGGLSAGTFARTARTLLANEWLSERISDDLVGDTSCDRWSDSRERDMAVRAARRFVLERPFQCR